MTAIGFGLFVFSILIITFLPFGFFSRHPNLGNTIVFTLLIGFGMLLYGVLVLIWRFAP